MSGVSSTNLSIINNDLSSASRSLVSDLKKNEFRTSILNVHDKLLDEQKYGTSIAGAINRLIDKYMPGFRKIADDRLKISDAKIQDKLTGGLVNIYFAHKDGRGNIKNFLDKASVALSERKINNSNELIQQVYNGIKDKLLPESKFEFESFDEICSNKELAQSVLDVVDVNIPLELERRIHKDIFKLNKLGVDRGAVLQTISACRKDGIDLAGVGIKGVNDEDERAVLWAKIVKEVKNFETNELLNKIPEYLKERIVPYLSELEKLGVNVVSVLKLIEACDNPNFRDQDLEIQAGLGHKETAPIWNEILEEIKEFEETLRDEFYVGPRELSRVYSQSSVSSVHSSQSRLPSIDEKSTLSLSRDSSVEPESSIPDSDTLASDRELYGPDFDLV